MNFRLEPQWDIFPLFIVANVLYAGVREDRGASPEKLSAERNAGSIGDGIREIQVIRAILQYASLCASLYGSKVLIVFQLHVITLFDNLRMQVPATCSFP